MSPSITYLDRHRLDMSFDVQKMVHEINQLSFSSFLYYEAVPLRAPAHLVDPSLPIPPPAQDYADGSWTVWKNAEYLESSPYLRSIVETFQMHTNVNLVRLLRLGPGEVVKEHTDPALGLEQERSVIRLTIPIVSKESVLFYLNGTVVPMQPGECWYMRLSDPHYIVNQSQTERINMTLDVVPNDWMKERILGR